MRVLINDHAGHPFQIQLSRELASRGHQVIHTYTNNLKTPRGILHRKETDPSTFKIVPLDICKAFSRYSLAKRYIQEIRLGSLLNEQVTLFRPDVVISANTPLGAQSRLIKKCLSDSIGFVYWLQDLLGIGIRNNLKKKLPYFGNLLGQYFLWKERRLLRNSDSVIVITEDFKSIVQGISQKKRNIHVIKNWAPLNDVPVIPKTNKWACNHNLDQTFNFVYTGTLGMKHNPELLIQLSLKMKKLKYVRVVVTSEGLGADYLEKQKIKLGLKNLKIFPFQPFQTIPKIQGAADVLIAILEPDAGFFSVPSKVLTYMCAKRPLLLAVPKENLSARIVTENQTGIVVLPSDIRGLLQAAEKLLHNKFLRKTMAVNGRNYAETHFDIEKITDKFEKIFCDIQSRVT